MALVVLIKGINVGGHRTFRPSLLAQQLKRFDVINIGAAGTFVVRRSISRVELRAEIERRLPFQADVMICSGMMSWGWYPETHSRDRPHGATLYSS
jgi:hypothetical protein